MADETALKQAQEVFYGFCKALDEDDWHYRADEEKLRIRFGARGEDLPIDLTVDVDANRRVVLVISPLSASAPKDKRLDMAIAVAVANHGLVHGSFDYDIKSGELYFRLTNSFAESKLGKEAMMYMVMNSCHVVDAYNDRFLMLAKGHMTLQQFIAAEKD